VSKTVKDRTAKAFKGKKTYAREFSSEKNTIINPLSYLVLQGNDVVYGKNLEFVQRIAAALNLFGTVMDAITNVQHKTDITPDKFTEYIVGGSWIAKIGYDFNNEKLRVWKMDGQIFTHLNVDIGTWLKLRQFESIGGGYNTLIRGKYPLEGKKNEV
jgi:hypothetical protein